MIMEKEKVCPEASVETGRTDSVMKAQELYERLRIMRNIATIWPRLWFL